MILMQQSKIKELEERLQQHIEEKEELERLRKTMFAVTLTVIGVLLLSVFISSLNITIRFSSASQPTVAMVLYIIGISLLCGVLSHIPYPKDD